jgi:hypothetical protein
MNLTIVPIYRIEQNTHRGDFSNKVTIWYLSKEKAEKYVDDFKQKHQGIRSYGHGGPIYAKLFEEYALFDGERYFSIGSVLSIIQ